MDTKTKSIIRKIVYTILFGLMIFAFIYLSEKYEENSQAKELSIKEYYNLDVKESRYEIINGSKMIDLINNGKNIIIIGRYTSDWSKKFFIEMNDILNELNIDKVYYYDLNNDKSQKNSNYYKIKELLKGSLTTTDGSNSNLLAPSFYIIIDGDVKYYNVDTVAMKNTIEIDDYWNDAKVYSFKNEIINAINKYYLNN